MTQNADNCRRLILWPGLICAIFDSGVSLWGIPILHPGGPDEPPSEEHKPLACLSFSAASLPVIFDSGQWSDIICSELPPWYSAEGQHLWFDCNVAWKDNRHLQRFCIETVGDGTSRQYVLKEGPPELVLSYNSVIDQDSSRMVGGRPATVVMSASGTACHYGMEVDGNSLEPCPPLPLTDRQSAERLNDMFSSCPFSGRFCFYPTITNEPIYGVTLDIVDLFPA